ncbi:MAG: DNA polymerase III subunit delta' C-terminal domain-containing protein [Lachnospiraceae bacterium]
MTPSEIRQYFREMAGRDQVGHAFILEGDSGEGWRKLAEEFAATVQCEHRNFCGRCPSCQAYQSGNHPDIIQVTHEKKDSIGVDEIRAQLVDDMAIKPYSSPYKVYLVDEAEKLTVQAQNALLKTLEEPPVYGIILLLTTNTEMLLPTIRSRCINLKVRSGGRVSLGLTEEQRAELFALVHDLPDYRAAELADEAKKIKEWKQDIASLLNFFRYWYRDVLVWKSTQGKGSLVFPEEERYYRARSEALSYAQLNRIFDQIQEAESRVRSNVNYELTWELLLLEMKNPKEEK